MAATTTAVPRARTPPAHFPARREPKARPSADQHDQDEDGGDEGGERGDQEPETEEPGPGRRVGQPRRVADGAAQAGEQPRGGGVDEQAAPPPAGQGVVGHRDGGVDDQGGHPRQRGSERSGGPVGAERTEDERTEHQELGQQPDVAEQDGRRPR